MEMSGATMAPHKVSTGRFCIWHYMYFQLIISISILEIDQREHKSDLFCLIACQHFVSRDRGGDAGVSLVLNFHVFLLSKSCYQALENQRSNFNKLCPVYCIYS